MNLLNVPDEHMSHADENEIRYNFNLTISTDDNKVKFSAGDISTSWLDSDDCFIDRIQFEKLNPYFLERHLAKEIEIKNALDRGVEFLGSEKYMKAIGMFDDVLYYDPKYGEALFFKSKALFGQKHFVKSLRYYKRAIGASDGLKDVEYHRLLLQKSSQERDNFPKIKRNIYAGDEYFAKGDYSKALKCYDKALANPTNFKNKILSKLLNKKATSLVKLNRIDEAIDVFKQSVSFKQTDYACYYLGIYDESSNPYLKKALKITKRQLLVKASKLNEFGETTLALECLNEFLDNHFVPDGDYESALRLKLEILRKLKMDTDETEFILSDFGDLNGK